MSMKTVALFTLAAALAAPTFADDRTYAKNVEFGRTKTTAAYVSNLADTMPQFVSGGGWSTTITLINFRPAAVTVPVSFYLDGGAALEVPIVGIGNRSTVEVTIPAGGSATLATDPAAGGNVRQGFARLDVPCTNPSDCGEVGGFAVFTQRVAGRPDFEAVVNVLSSLAGKYVVAFDTTSGFATGLAIATPSFATGDTADRTVRLIARDEAGTVLVQDTVTMKANGQQAFSLTDKYSQLANHRGTVEVSTTDYVTVLGLRFNPSGAFTTIPPYER